MFRTSEIVYSKKKAKYVHIQVALFHNDSFFHQLGQNIATDCSSDLHKISVWLDQICIATYFSFLSCQ